MSINYPNFWSKKNIISSLMTPFSWVYLLLGFIRKIFVKPVKLPYFVICVGNASVGGTGKTQIVMNLAQSFAKKNINFVIVTKGYKSNLSKAKIVEDTDTSLDVGDESILLKEFATIIAAKKVQYSVPLLEKINPDVVIFDDGMQNPGFSKDYIILVADARRGVGNNRILPAGPLRQNFDSAIKKSNCVILVGKSDESQIEQKTESFGKELYRANMKFTKELDKDLNYYVFSGIGDPARFLNMIKDAGCKVEKTKYFPDHYDYQSADIDSMIKEAKENNLQLVTTRKDYVKMSDNNNIVCLDVQLEMQRENNLLADIYEKIKTHS